MGQAAMKRVLKVLPFTKADLRLPIAVRKGRRNSISGVQAKVLLDLIDGEFRLVESGGDYILKPVPSDSESRFAADIPANEHLTMQIASRIFGIETAENCCVRFADGELAYLTRRFDRRDGGAVRQEDLCQIAGRSEDTHGSSYKYDFSYEEMAEKFHWCPQALANTNKIADRCNVTLEFGKLLLPRFETEDGSDEPTYLRKLCDEALPKLYPNAGQEVYDRLDFELGIINQMGYAAYFLIVWDYINYSKTHDIPVGPGRGSGAGSLAAYCMGITNIDPIKNGLFLHTSMKGEEDLSERMVPQCSTSKKVSLLQGTPESPRLRSVTCLPLVPCAERKFISPLKPLLPKFAV